MVLDTRGATNASEKSLLKSIGGGLFPLHIDSGRHDVLIADLFDKQRNEDLVLVPTGGHTTS